MRGLRAFVFFLATVAIYLGVPLLGWGLRDLVGFLSSAPRAAYAGLVILFGLAVGVQAIAQPMGIRGGREEVGKRIPRQHLVRILVIALMYLGLFLLPYADRRSLLVMAHSLGWQLAGAVFAGIGCGLVFWSGLSLGRQYSPEVTLQTSHRLITGGAYRLVRHPRYLGVASLAVGLALLFRFWPGLALFPVILGILLFRIHDEERLMREAFGQEWEAYARRTRRLIPLLY